MHAATHPSGAGGTNLDQRRPGAKLRAASASRLPLEVVDLEGRLLWWCGEATLDALSHSRHQDRVAELLPTLFGLVDRHNRPATGRRASGVKDLTLWHGLSTRMHGSDRRLVLLFRTTRKVMHNPVRHSRPPLKASRAYRPSQCPGQLATKHARGR